MKKLLSLTTIIALAAFSGQVAAQAAKSGDAKASAPAKAATAKASAPAAKASAPAKK